MPIHDLFSKRRKRAAGETADVYIYTIPEKLRVQIIHIWGDAIGKARPRAHSPAAAARKISDKRNVS